MQYLVNDGVPGQGMMERGPLLGRDLGSQGPIRLRSSISNPEDYTAVYGM